MLSDLRYRLRALFRSRNMEHELENELQHYANEVDRLVSAGVPPLRRRPGFAIAVIASLALGIGANTAIFTLIDAVVLRSLPVQEPQGLWFVSRTSRRRRHTGMATPSFAICALCLLAAPHGVA